MKRLSRRLSTFIIMVMIAALLPWTAAQAAGQENVMLTAEKDKVKLEVQLPDDSQGVSTLRLRLKVQGDTAKLNQDEPFTFKAAGDISSSLLETRFQENTGYLTIYISDTDKVTDKTYFELGTIIPNSVDDSEYELTFSIPEDGLEFVDETGTLNEEIKIVSSAVGLKVNAAEKNPDTEQGGDDDTSNTESDKKPSETLPDSEDGNNTSSEESQGQIAQRLSALTGDYGNLLICLVLIGIGAAGIAAVVVLKKNNQRE